MSYHLPRGSSQRRSLPGRAVRHLHPRSELGQAAFAMVTGIAILLVLTAGILVSTNTEHDPLVSADLLQHIAYRGLEAGIDSYLTTINSNPNLINCNTSNTTGSPNYTGGTAGSPGCTSTLLPALDSWTQVPDTSGDGSSVPEFYMWSNPQFCFSNVLGTVGNPTCTAPSTTAGATLVYVRETVYGAAEIGNQYAYQSAQAEFTPENGFLSNIWWSNYEATDPETSTSNVNTAQADCTYDWNNNYYGPDTNNNNGSVPFPNSSYCSPVYFGPSDIIYGPLYSNDSIYVDGQPDFGVSASASGTGSAVPSTVTTHDPGCLFVDPIKSEWSPTAGRGACSNATSQVGEYNTTASSDNAPFEPIPTSDSQLGTLAAQDGCEYSGPTTIYLYVNTSASPSVPYMVVTSPDTPTSGSSDLDNSSANSNNCGIGTNAGIGVPVPSGSRGNGVIFAENTPSTQTCVSGANPFEDTSNGDSGGAAQTPGTNYYDVTGTSEDCEADVFVSNASSLTGSLPTSGATAGVSGNLTIASQNNIVIDGNITYTTADCGSTFNSTYTHQCQYNSGTTPNDSLGLIAYHFVEVDHPVATTTTCNFYFFGNCGSYSTTTTVEPSCTAFNAPAPPDCNPSGPGLTIDAAILALNDSFTVNNYTVGSSEGQLGVYGAIAQDWRGAVGQFNTSTGSVTSGYSKYYLWDSRLDYVTVPYYLNPGTPSWGLTSTGVLQGQSNPCATTGALPYPWPQTTGTSPTCLSTAITPPSLPV